MKSATKIIAGFLAILLLAGYSAYTVVSLDVKPVNAFSVTEKGLTYQKFCWNMDKHASGYKIYQKNAKNDNYTLVDTIKSFSKTECTIDNLDMETYYSFKITAYKNILGYVVESEMSDELKTCTLPRGEEIENIVEQTPKTLTVSWSMGLNCDGYEIEYAKKEDFSDAIVKKIVGITTILCKLDSLEQNETYYIRLRSFITHEDEILYSEYSDTYSATVKNLAAREEIDPDKPMIALTFDDGPDFNGNSKKILDVIEKHGIRATFFTVGENAKRNPENITRKVALGCEIGNHTYSHKYYGKNVDKQEISRCSEIIKNITGSRPTVFRSTGGITTAGIKNFCKKQGMSLYYWTIDTQDWKTRDAKKIYKSAMKAQDGDIILMHDIYPETAKAVRKLIPKLKKKGFQFVTVSELVKYKSGNAPKSGVQYISGTKISN